MRNKDGKQVKPYVTIDECPPNLHHSHNIFPEAILYLLVKDHPLIIGGSPLKRSASTHPRFNIDLENDSSDDDDKEILLKKKLKC